MGQACELRLLRLISSLDTSLQAMGRGIRNQAVDRWLEEAIAIGFLKFLVNGKLKRVSLDFSTDES